MRNRTNKRYGPYYDTGGKGAIPTSRGNAAKWWVPSHLTSIPRLLMATRLAMAPATMEDLRNASGLCFSSAYMVMRNWVERRYADWTLFLPSGGRRTDARFRIATITREGRRDLWRYAQVTQRLRFSDTSDAPLRNGMPEDPLEALRLNARPEFLRPAALALLDELLGWPGQTGCEIAGHTGFYWTTIDWLVKFRNAGFLTDVTGRRRNSRGVNAQHWILNDDGHEALDRHIDALRRAALAGAYTPERPCEYSYPRPYVSHCASEMNEHTPPPCPDCPYYHQVILEQQLYRQKMGIED